MENTFFGAERPVPFWTFVGGVFYLSALGAALVLFVLAPQRNRALQESPVVLEQFSDTATLPRRDKDREKEDVRALLRR